MTNPQLQKALHDRALEIHARNQTHSLSVIEQAAREGAELALWHAAEVMHEIHMDNVRARKLSEPH